MSSDCPLSDREQTRNIWIYVANWALIYLASPVVYVGIVQATLVKRLGFSDTISNLPASAYLWTTPLPLIVVWAFPQVRMLKPLIVISYSANALMSLVVVLALLQDDPEWILVALVADALVLGVTGGVLFSCHWEVVGRGISQARRGKALGLAFGFGPVMAVVASLGADLLLRGKLPGVEIELLSVASPWNFAIIFLASVPAQLLGALFSAAYVVPPLAFEAPRQPFFEGIFGGFGEYLGYRLILLATLGYVLVYSGFQVLQNMSLYTRVALGESPDKYAGLQLALRFGFKVAAGFFLGWLLVRTNPKTLLIATAAVCMLAVTWALNVPGRWFLISFGIMGAGELFGVYYPNYILGCSPPSRMRRNIALSSLLTLPVGFAPLMYGRISDVLGAQDKAFGYEMSFTVSIMILYSAIVLVLIGLPARPHPREDQASPVA